MKINLSKKKIKQSLQHQDNKMRNKENVEKYYKTTYKAYISYVIQLQAIALNYFLRNIIINVIIHFFIIEQIICIKNNEKQNKKQ